MDELSNFPLTEKWTPAISKLAYQHRILLSDLIHEARIIEWQCSQKIADLIYRENYFKKVIYKSLIGSYCNRNGLGKSWWATHKVSCNNEDNESNDLLDSIISTNPFNVIYHNNLIEHISSILSSADEVLKEIFILRITLGLRWKEIRKYFPNIAHNRFYSMVKEIKDTVKKEAI